MIGRTANKVLDKLHQATVGVLVLSTVYFGVEAFRAAWYIQKHKAEQRVRSSVVVVVLWRGSCCCLVIVKCCMHATDTSAAAANSICLHAACAQFAACMPSARTVCSSAGIPSAAHQSRSHGHHLQVPADPAFH